MKRHSKALMTSLFGIALLSVGCARKSLIVATKVAPKVVIGSGEGLFPSETITDWVSYASHVMEVTVLSESEIPPPPAVVRRGEGYVGRRIHALLGETIWSASGASPTPKEIDLTVSGSVLKDGERVPFALVNSARLEVGGRYIVPLVQIPRPVTGWHPPERTERAKEADVVPTEMQWSLLATDTPFEVTGDEIATKDTAARGGSPLSRELAAETRANLVARFAAAPVDPIASKHMQLPPEKRIAAVMAEKAQVQQ